MARTLGIGSYYLEALRDGYERRRIIRVDGKNELWYSVQVFDPVAGTVHEAYVADQYPRNPVTGTVAAEIFINTESVREKISQAEARRQIEQSVQALQAFAA